MNNVTNKHVGSVAAAHINGNLAEAGIDTAIGNTHGSVASATLNGVLGGTLNESQSGSEWTGAAIDDINAAASATYTFLHLSDTHGYTACYDVAINALNNDPNIDKVLLTGDIVKYVPMGLDNTTKSRIETLSGMGDKLLMVPGNHDTYENKHTGFGGKYNQACETAWLKHVMGENVVWGDTSGVGGWWYKDVICCGRTIRFIGLDQYEIGTTEHTVQAEKFFVVYSQAQIDWLLDLLYETPSNYYIIIMMHETPVRSTQDPDNYATGISGDNANLFTSVLLHFFGTRVPQENVLPRIMRAYLHKESVNFSFSCQYADRDGNQSINVVKDYSGVTPAKFLFYIGGHLHFDLHSYIKQQEWSDQLMLYVTAGDSGCQYAETDDLLWNYNVSKDSGVRYASGEPSYRINKVSIDFVNETITVERLGNKTTAPTDTTGGTARPLGSRVRSSITFPLVKGGEG
jgi:hypothetical protein